MARDLDSVFWAASRAGAASAWWGHVPFAHWLVAAIRPGMVVELGTYNGVSFAAFCEAMQRENIIGRCYAVDTWKGDEHGGFYDESAFLDLSAFIRSRYGALSELVRLSFDEALPSFADGSIDLLHIDGFHTYEAVKKDFNDWLPKLSDRAVVLLHDTNVRERRFGVWKLWAELSENYPSFEFVHGHGLGIAAVGRDIPEPVIELCKLAPDAANVLRERFAQLGARWVAEASNAARAKEQSAQIASLDMKNAEQAEKNAEQAAQIASLDMKNAEQAEKNAEQAAQIASLDMKNAEQAEKNAEQAAQIASLDMKNAEQAEKNAEQAAQIASLDMKNAEQAAQIASLDMKNAEQAEKNAEQAAQIASLDMKNAEQAEKNAEQAAQIASLDMKNAEQAAQIASLRQSTEHLTRTLQTVLPRSMLQHRGASPDRFGPSRRPSNCRAGYGNALPSLRLDKSRWSLPQNGSA